MTMLMPAIRREVAPWSALRELEDGLERVFGGFDSESAWTPAVDLQETEEGYVLKADLPGLEKKDISLTVEEDVVTLSGERKDETRKEGKGYCRIERARGSFRRSFRLPAGIDANKVSAEFSKGVLHVTLPKPETAKPKQIDVKIK